ncbi:MAG: ROK family protein, partial [Oscillospiraceae bacterium]
FYAASGHSVEIGHCVVVPGGRPCKCGLHGCLEMHAAGPAIVQNYLQLGGKTQIGGEAPNAKSIETLARKGDAAALQTYAEEGHLLGKMLAIAGNLLGPQKIVIGGSVSKAFDLFSPALAAALQAGLYSQASGAIQVQPSPLAEFGGLAGAAALAFARSNQLFDLQNTLQGIYGAPQH